MAWGWETANICQSKLSWVLLGFGEWKADKASPHTLGCTRQEESREDGTGGGAEGGSIAVSPCAAGLCSFRVIHTLQNPTQSVGTVGSQI